MKKKRKIDEAYLWAELQGNEAAIKALNDRNGEIRTELTHRMIHEVKIKQAAGEVS